MSIELSNIAFVQVVETQKERSIMAQHIVSIERDRPGLRYKIWTVESDQPLVCEQLLTLATRGLDLRTLT
jgi:hypothetical protein